MINIEARGGGELARHGNSGARLRLSIGLEAAAGLTADLEQALG